MNFQNNSWRIASPVETYSRIKSKMPLCGISRAADITGLDDLDIPVFCAIRPGGVILQVSNGKGLTRDAAKVSAIMEAIEVDHAERPSPSKLRWCSYDKLCSESTEVIDPEMLPGKLGNYWNREFVIPWYKGRNCIDHSPVWIPAGFIFFNIEPVIFQTTSNGLASGNHILEAEIHGLLELIERDTLATVFQEGNLVLPSGSQIINTEAEFPRRLKELITKITQRKNLVLLIRIHDEKPLHTFWAIILNESAFSSVSTVNVGSGTHLAPEIAALRAITEAAQSRATFIHAGREDLLQKKSFIGKHVHESVAILKLKKLKPNADWSEIPKFPIPKHETLVDCHSYLLELLRQAGHELVFGFDLTKSTIGIPVARMFIPNMRLNLKIL